MGLKRGKALVTTTDMTTVDTQNLVENFDYSRVDPGVAGFVQKRKANMIQRSIVSVIADGHDLLAIRQALGTDKLFREWIEAEYWFSYQTAQKRMHVAEMVDDNSRGKLSLLQQYENKKVSELYELAAAYRRPQIEASFNRNDHGIGVGETDDYHTPPTILASVWQVMTIDVDPASDDEANTTVQATTYYTEQDDGLYQEWHGNIFLNPPHKQIEQFLTKLFEEYQQGHVTEAIALLPDRSEAEWYKRVYPCWHCRFLDRQRFIKHGETEPNGKAPFGSVALYLGDHPERFAEVFHQYGPVYPPISEYIPFGEEDTPYEYETSENGLADNLEGALNDQDVLEDQDALADLDTTEQPDQSNGVQPNESNGHNQEEPQTQSVPDQSNGYTPQSPPRGSNRQSTGGYRGKNTDDDGNTIAIPDDYPKNFGKKSWQGWSPGIRTIRDTGNAKLNWNVQGQAFQFGPHITPEQMEDLIVLEVDWLTAQGYANTDFINKLKPGIDTYQQVMRVTK
jgi:hypothetical protein